MSAGLQQARPPPGAMQANPEQDAPPSMPGPPVPEFWQMPATQYWVLLHGSPHLPQLF